MTSEYPGIENLIAYEDQVPLKSDNRQRERRVAVVKLLGWLLDRAERDIRNPLELKAGTAWSEQIQELLREDTSLNKLFYATADALDFRQEINEEQMRKVEQFVASHYDPLIFDD
jgi:hypothetical protein